MATQHKITILAKALHCHECLRQSAPTARGRAGFLATPCYPDRKLLDTLKIADTRPSMIPSGRVVRVGSRQLHPGHRLCVYRGLFYCLQCGYAASVKAQELVKPCTARGSRAQKRIGDLKRGKLPSGHMRWPSDSMKEAIIELDNRDEDHVRAIFMDCAAGDGHTGRLDRC